MAFDPDAYLGGTATEAQPASEGFNPDSYLAQSDVVQEDFNPDEYLGAVTAETRAEDGRLIVDRVPGFLDKLARFNEGSVSGALDSIAGVARIGENLPSFTLANSAGFKAIADTVQGWSQANREFSKEFQNREDDASFASGLTTAAGQFVPQVAAAASSGGLSVLANVGQMFEQEYSTAKEKGASEETAVTAGLANIPAAALDWLGERFVVGKLLPNGAGRPTIAEMGKRIATAFGIEGGTEVAQDEYSAAVAERLGYDPNRPMDRLKTFLIGGILGGGVATLEQGAQRIFTPELTVKAAEVGPATEAVVSSTLDQGVQPDIIDSTELNTTQTQATDAPLSDLENSLASEDLEAAETLLLNPGEAFQTPSDLLAAIEEPILNEQTTNQNMETSVPAETIGTDIANDSTLASAAIDNGIEADAEVAQDLDQSTPPPLFLSLNEEHRPVIDQWTAQLANSGITQDRVALREDIPNPMRINWDEEGNVILEVNRNEASRLNADELGTLFHEEVVHAENINAVRDTWDKAIPFQQHLDSEMGKVVAEGRALGINVDSAKIYDHESYSEALEIIRQLVQGRQEGTVSEAVVRPEQAPTIFALLERMLNKFRTLLSQNPDSTLVSYVKNIEIALYGQSDIGANQGGIPTTLPAGSIAIEPYQPNAPPALVTNYFTLPAGSPPIDESPSSYTEYQGKQFPVYSGDKIKKSKGAFGDNYFYAPNTQALWSAGADGFLQQFPNTPEGMRQANNLINDPSAPMDDATKNFVRSQMQVRLIEMGKISNIIDRQQAYSLLDSISSAQLQSGTSEAQALASRAGSNKQLQPYSGWLAGRNILVARQEQEVAKHFDDNPEIKVRQAAEQAGVAARTATESAAQGDPTSQVPKAQAQAEVLSDMLNKVFADSTIWPDHSNQKNEPTVRQLYSQRVKGTLTDAEFQEQLQSLGVSEASAAHLEGLAQINIEGNEQAKGYKEMLSRIEASNKQADLITDQLSKVFSDPQIWEDGKVHTAAKATVKNLFKARVGGRIDENQFISQLQGLGVTTQKASVLEGLAKLNINAIQQDKDFKAQEAAGKQFDRLIGTEIKRMFNQINKSEGISWRDIFRNLPVGAQRERQAYLRKAISEHPQLQNLTKSQQSRLSSAIQVIWAKERQRVFKENLGREGAVGEKAKADREKVIQTAPKLLQYLNTGNLSTADFRDILSERYGIAQLNGESMNKLRELAEQAYNSPEGVIRNKLLDQINRELFNIQGIRPWDILKDVWFAGVLSSPKTWVDIMSGGLIVGGFNNMIQVADTALWNRSPKKALRLFNAFWGTMGESFANAKDIIANGDYSRLSDADRQLNDVLEGKSSPDRLETIKEQSSFWESPILWTAAQASYVRRMMTAMDYLTQLPTREANILYIADMVDPEMYQAAVNKYNKESSVRAEEQAKNELGAQAKKVDIYARKREILEAEIDEDVKQRASDMARIAALNQDPKGIGGIIQRAIAVLPFAIRGPAGLAFSRTLINMVQLASHATPILGAVNYGRSHPVVKSWVDRALPGEKRGKRSEMAEILSPDITPEQLRVMAAYQLIGLGMTMAIAAFRFGLDDDDRPWEISGSWQGLTFAQKQQLRDQGERPLSIRLGTKGNGVWLNYKNFPFMVVPFAMIGNMSDKQRFAPKDWLNETILERSVDGFAAGLYYFKDLSMISTLSAAFGQDSYSNRDFESIGKSFAQLGGSFASGFIPFNSLIRDIDAWSEDKYYKPESGTDYWINNIPFARRAVGSGPAVNAFGDPISVSRAPWARIASLDKEGSNYQFLGSQSAQGNFAPVASTPDVWDPKERVKVSLKTLSPSLYYEYQVKSGEYFEKLVMPQKDKINAMTPDQAKAIMKAMRDAANDKAQGEIQRKISRGER